MATKYQWTDWITHVPGQQLPIGTHALIEFVGFSGEPYVKEGMVAAKHKNHPCWFQMHNCGIAVMITRYKLRSIADETEAEQSAEDLVEA